MTAEPKMGLRGGGVIGDWYASTRLLSIRLRSLTIWKVYKTDD